MARYIYHGPVQSIALAVRRIKDKDGNAVSRFTDIDLRPGKETPELPADNPIIASMIDAGQLVAVTSEGSAQSKSARAGKKGDT
jgi:hypothetical protein